MKNFLLSLLLLSFGYNSYGQYIVGAPADTAKWNPNYFFKIRTASPVVPLPPSEKASSYAPAGFRKQDTTWLYTKADNTNQVFSFYSTDEGQSFTFADTAVAYRLPDVDWHHKLTSDPAVLADSAAGIVHCLFKGRSGVAGDSISIGYGSVSFANPRRFTIQNSGNCVMSPTYIKAVTGNNNISDVSPADIIKIGSLYYVYISMEDIVAGNYKIYLFTTSNFLSYNYIGIVLQASKPFDMATKPAIFKINDLYYMQVGHQKYSIGQPNGVLLYKWSKDAIHWNDLPGRFIETAMDTSRWDYSRVYAATVIRNTDGYNLTPALYTDHWNIYYSGSSIFVNGNKKDRCGLAKVYPFQYEKDSLSHTPDNDIKMVRTAQSEFREQIIIPDGVIPTFTGTNNYNIVVRMTSVPNTLAEATPDAIYKQLHLKDSIEKSISDSLGAITIGTSGSATLDFPLTAAGTSVELTITVTGAADGDPVIPGTPNVSTNANSCFTYWVSATNTVTVKFNNYSSGAIDPAPGTFKAIIIK